MCGSKCNLMYSICNSLMYKMLYYQILCIRKICMCGKKPVALLVTYILHFNSSLNPGSDSYCQQEWTIHRLVALKVRNGNIFCTLGKMPMLCCT